MTAVFYRLGVTLVTACAIAGFSLVASLFTDWIIDRFKLKRDLLIAAHRMFQERNAKKLDGGVE